jgi:AhpD family alkylhydroperoxidase
MARISGVSAQDADQEVQMTYQYARQGLAELTGRETENMMEPLELLAHVPGLLRGLMAMEQAVAELNGIDRRLKALANLKTATLTHCEYCIDIASQVSRQWGLSDEEMLALPFYQTSPLFNDLEKLVLDYAVGMSRTPVEVSDALFARLREHFDDAQLVELTYVIALENLHGRFNLALGAGSADFTEGMVCAVPAFA